MPNCSAISAKVNADAPTKIVRIQKMITAGSNHYTYSGFGALFRGQSGRRSRQHLHPDRQRGLVDSKSRRVMRRRYVALGPGAEHEIATRYAGEELGEVVAHRERPAQPAGPVADELVADVQHGLRDVRLVHQGHGSVHQVDLGAHLERALRLAQQVAQPVERLLA